MKKKLFETLKFLARTAMTLFIFLAVFKTGALYGEQHEAGEDIIPFFTKQVEYEYNSRNGPPEELVQSIEKYNDIVKTIWLALLFSGLTMFFDYYIDPENHFITSIKKRYKNMPKGGETDEREENEENY